MDPINRSAYAPPLAFVVLLLAGWVNRQQQAVIDYLLEERSSAQHTDPDDDA
jgi:hypothetical protein